MKLWTIQPEEVYSELMKTGIYRCNPALSFANEYDEFENAYDWLAKEMAKRISPPPEGIRFPVWAWYSYDFMHIRPDMRRLAFRIQEPSVLMEIEIPDNEVLLSDEVNWGIFVLNNSYFPPAIDEKTWDEKEEWFKSLTTDEKEIIKKKSWEYIFDVEPFENDFFAKGCYVQATFWELKEEQIVKTWHLKGHKSL